jgi:hypothetical protein
MRMTIAIAAAILLLAPSLASAADVYVQAEDYVYAYDIGYYPITTSGGLLYGVDTVGEWVQYELPGALYGTYTVTMRCWGDPNVPYVLQLVTLPSDPEDVPQAITLEFIGKGSCGS